MHKKFEINRTKIKGDNKFKGDNKSERKVVTHNSKSDLPLVFHYPSFNYHATRRHTDLFACGFNGGKYVDGPEKPKHMTKCEC